MNEKISVIIPAYNEENRIQNCINSLIIQTYSNIEILIINDGSTDNTLGKIKEINDNRIRVITIKNHGQGFARNIGIKKSTGCYITFVDADDTVDKEMIEKLYIAIKSENFQISICNIIKCYSNGKESKFINYTNLSNSIQFNFMISHPGPVARLYQKELFTSNNISFLENCIYEDLGTIPLIGIHASKIKVLDDFLYYYNIRKNSSMKQETYSPKMEDIFYVMEFLEKKLGGLKKYKSVIEYLYIEHLLYSASLRFLKFKNTKKIIDRIGFIISTKYPNWNNNEFYKNKSIKFKIICNLVMNKKYILLKICNFIKK